MTERHYEEHLTPFAFFVYITPFHSPSTEHIDFLSLGGLEGKQKGVTENSKKTKRKHLLYNL